MATPANFSKFQEILLLYSIQQNSKQFHIKSALFTVMYPSASKKTRSLQLNTGRVHERPLGAGGLNWSKRDTTVWFVRGSEGTSSAILLNISHIVYIINGEYC